MATLTKKERAWLNELQEVLDRCPSPKKIGFYTIGDKSITCMTYAAWMKSWRLLIIVRRWIGVLLFMI
ncbi:phage protein [Escherichia coli]|uniref:Phage protein n=1 Tax=Escherichia coli TaxID=562 RepID=A0A2X3LZF6_ECOLX|nr:phage protein [Escherichia coli]